MQILAINNVSNSTFSGKTDKNHSDNRFSNSQLDQLSKNKELIDALYVAGIIKKNNLNMINKALRKRDEEIKQARLAEAKRQEKATLAEKMQYVIDNIKSPNIEESKVETRRIESRIEYDDFTDIYYDVTLQDAKLESALKFIKEHADLEEYKQLFAFRQENASILEKKGMAVEFLFDDMEKGIREKYEPAPFNPNTCVHDDDRLDNIIRKNPIKTLDDTLASLKNKLNSVY